MLSHEAAVDAGVGSFIAADHEIEGVPSTANKWLMQALWIRQWGDHGLIVTEYSGLSGLIYHGLGYRQIVPTRAL